MFICHTLQQHVQVAIFTFPEHISHLQCVISESGGHRMLRRGDPVIEHANRLFHLSFLCFFPFEFN